MPNLHRPLHIIVRTFASGKKTNLAIEFIEKAKKDLQTVSLDEEDRQIYSSQIHETEAMTRQ